MIDDELDDMDGVKKEPGAACVKSEKDNAATSNAADKKDTQNNAPKTEKDVKEAAQRAKELKVNESDVVRDLKTQLK